LNFLSRFEISHQAHNSCYSMHSAHSHSYYEMFYLKDGFCEFFIDNQKYIIKKGMVIFVPINTLHQTFYLEAPLHERISINFTLDFVSDIIEYIGIKHFKNIISENIFTIPEDILHNFSNLINNISFISNTNNIYTLCYEKLYFQQLILMLFNQTLRTDKKTYNSKNTNIETIDKVINMTMLYIDQNYSKDISLSEVAKIANLNPSYFSKKFKAVNGFGFKDYLNKVRINHSEKLLIETNKSITDIAFECGYINSNYFGDAFKHLNKVSPSVFRKMHENLS